jgi:hypothetical protein
MKMKNMMNLKRVVDMYWDIEKNYWEDTAPPHRKDKDRHIFLSINNIKNWLERNKQEGLLATGFQDELKRIMKHTGLCIIYDVREDRYVQLKTGDKDV